MASSPQKRKPRFITLNANFKDGLYPDMLRINSKDQSLEFLKEGAPLTPNTASIDWGYTRPRKEKTIRKYPVPTTEIGLHPDNSLIHFETVYVIDTNTDPINKISVSCCLRGKPEFDEHGHKVGIRFRDCPYFAVRGKVEYPERSAWRQLIEKEVKTTDGKTLIIVDSDLDNLESFNSRKKPIIGDFYTPDYVTFMYASADVGKEHIVNKIMSKADKAASKLLARILSGELKIPT